MPIADDAAIEARHAPGVSTWQGLAGLLAVSWAPGFRWQAGQTGSTAPVSNCTHGPDEPDEAAQDRDEALLLALTSLPIY